METTSDRSSPAVPSAPSASDRVDAAGVAAWPAPAGAPVLLFGGTFDPPHKGHTELALAARDELFGDAGWLVFVPAARNPHKPDGPIATEQQRVEMLRLATRGADRVGVWTDEIDRAQGGDPSYWVDTIRRAAAIAGPGTPLRFLIGADQAIAFDRWREHERILEYAEPAVMLRDPCPTLECYRSMLLNTGLDPAEWIPRLVATQVHPAASTFARNAIRRGNIPSELLDEQVMGYIDLHGLYAE